MNPIHSIGIIGGGAWGTALAQALRATGAQVQILAREKKVVEDITLYHHNHDFLPGIKLDVLVKATLNLSEMSVKDVLLLAVPAQHIRAMCKLLVGRIPKEVPFVVCAKGIETESGKLMSEIVTEILPEHPLATLSGPTFAAEVAKGLPAAVALASKDIALARHLAGSFGSKAFRPYSSSDVVGVEVAGALKNVIAIGCGIVIGKGLGENARAALMTRGLSEIAQLAIALGGKQETLMGLSGLGDLVLTCGSPQSRNMSLGIALGKGRKLQDILGERSSVSEGVATSAAALLLAKKHKIDTPIMAAIASILHANANIDQTIDALLARPLKGE